MNTTKIFTVAAFAVLGLIVGYALFGKWAGEYVSLETLFSFDGNPFQKVFRVISGVEDMRDKILICGVVGAVVGMFATFGQKQ